MTREIRIQKVTPEDLHALLIFSKKTFFDAFYHLNNQDDMEAYAAKYFTYQQLEAELRHPHSTFYFAFIDNEIVGYLKLNYADAQTEFQDARALEIERIYVSIFHQNKRIGYTLLEFAVAQAKAKQLQHIWLGVWEKNDKAIRFYQRHGFEIFSEHNFMLGTDLQTDLLLRRTLN